MTESSRSKTLEVMARAAHAAVTNMRPESAEAIANAIFAHLQAEGMAVVPVVPSGGMLHAGSSAYDHPSVYMGGPSEGGKRLSARIYRAMLKAASEKEKDDA